MDLIQPGPYPVQLLDPNVREKNAGKFASRAQTKRAKFSSLRSLRLPRHFWHINQLEKSLTMETNNDIEDMEEEEEFGFSRNYFLAKELGSSGKKSARKLSEINLVDEQVLALKI